jgi:SAM-dependent methyltransferase
MPPQSTETLITFYRDLFQKYGSGPEATGGSVEGRRFRFAKLMEIADLKNQRILDLGCGLGDLYPVLMDRFGTVDYTGIDIVPETVAAAATKYPQARFQCRDVRTDGIDATFDYILLNEVFNNVLPDNEAYMKEVLTIAFRHCTRALAFNFISTYVNYRDGDRAYHDPLEILGFCLKTLTRKVTMYHHYERCDVAVFAYK